MSATMIKITEKNSGKTITRINTTDFMNVMKREFHSFKFVADAIAFYNKHYPKNKAIQELK